MPIDKFLDRDSFGSHEIKILNEAFETALRFADVYDRTGILAELVAKRVVEEFKKGEVDPARIAHRAIAMEGALPTKK